MTKSFYRLSLVDLIAVREVDNINIAMQAYGIKLTKDSAKKKFRLLEQI